MPGKTTYKSCFAGYAFKVVVDLSYKNQTYLLPCSTLALADDLAGWLSETFASAGRARGSSPAK